MKGFSPDFLDVLAEYRWPGNVRELYSALESAAAHAQYEPTLFPKHLPTNIRIEVARSSVGGLAPDGTIAAIEKSENAHGMVGLLELGLPHLNKMY